MLYRGRELDRTEARRMMLIGIPTFVTVLVAAQRLGPLAYVAFCFIAMIPYSYLYSMAYRAFAIAEKPSRKAKFYIGAISVQFVAIAGILSLHFAAR